MPILSDVSSHEAQDIPIVSGHTIGVTHKVIFQQFQLISISETCEDEKQYFPVCLGPLKTSGGQNLTGRAFHASVDSYSHC